MGRTNSAATCKGHFAHTQHSSRSIDALTRFLFGCKS